MSDAPAPRPGLRVHPLDLLVLVLAVFGAVLAYAYLFRRSPVPRPVDPLLGAEVVVEFPADREWKKTFPPPGGVVLLEDLLVCDVVEQGSADGNPPGRVRVRLRVRGRDDQQPSAITQFRGGVRRGSTLRMRTDRSREPFESEVQVEVLSVEGAEPGKR